MKISCPHCGQHYEVEDDAVGTVATCENCWKDFPVEVGSSEDRTDAIDAIVRQYLRPGDSELMRQALEVVVGERKASTSYFQRRFRIGYNIAAELADELERRGVISGPTAGSVERKILLPPIQKEAPPPPPPRPVSNPAPTATRCPFCGGEIAPGVKKCRHCGEWIELSAKPKNPVVYVLLALFVGIFGIHNFYADEDAGIFKILGLLMVGLIAGFAATMNVSVSCGVLAFYFLIIAFVNMGDMANCDSRLQNAARKAWENIRDIEADRNNAQENNDEK